MCATDPRGRRLLRSVDSQRGSTLVLALLLALVVAGLCVTSVISSLTSNRRARTRLETSKAFYVAEGGLDFALGQLDHDALWPVADLSRFPTLNGDGSLVSNWVPLGDGSGAFQMRVVYQKTNAVPDAWTSPGFPPGFQRITDVTISDRAVGPPDYDRLEVRVDAVYGNVSRSVRATLQKESTIFRSAIVSDSPPLTTDVGNGKSAALSNGHVSFKGGNQYVYGGIHANAKIVGTSGELTDADASTYFDGWDGAFESDLYQTPNEIPDYTRAGSVEQLFDFGRFEACAAAGCGQIFTSIADFEAAMEAANGLGNALEGVIYLKIDAAVEGSGPTLEPTGGINIRGTLVFDFSNTPDDLYKVFILCPLNINAATLPGNFDPADETTFTTGFPPTLPSSKDARGYSIGSAVYEDFDVDADMPALMFDTGTVDIHGPANVCGAVYGPSFIEIENKGGNLQYFAGTILGGGGIYVEGKSASGAAQVFYYTPTAINALPTFGDLGETLTISGYMVGD